jgi:hypothetical protein
MPPSLYFSSVSYTKIVTSCQVFLPLTNTPQPLYHHILMFQHMMLTYTTPSWQYVSVHTHWRQVHSMARMRDAKDFCPTSTYRVPAAVALEQCLQDNKTWRARAERAGNLQSVTNDPLGGMRTIVWAKIPRQDREARREDEHQEATHDIVAFSLFGLCEKDSSLDYDT